MCSYDVPERTWNNTAVRSSSLAKLSGMETIVIHAPDLAAVWTSMAQARATSSADDGSLRTVAFHMSLFLVLLLPIGHAMASMAAAASSIQRHSTLYTVGLETAAGIEPATVICMGVAVLTLVLQLLSAVLHPLTDGRLFVPRCHGPRPHLGAARNTTPAAAVPIAAPFDFVCRGRRVSRYLARRVVGQWMVRPRPRRQRPWRH